MKNSLIFFFFLILFFSCKTENKQISLSTKTIPKNLKQEVAHDLSHVFSSTENNILTQKIIDYEKVSTNEIAILTVDSISPYTHIHKFGIDISNLWGIGKKEKNNGLLITLCKPCRLVSISTGYGTEKIITDSICKNLIDNTLTPNFKNNDYFIGINTVLDSIITKWKPLY